MQPGEKANRKIILRTFDNIHLVKVQGNQFLRIGRELYHIHLLNGKKIIVSTLLKEYDELLRDSGFYRVHKSYLINMRQISRFEKGDGGYVVLENESKVRVHSRGREELVDKL